MRTALAAVFTHIDGSNGTGNANISLGLELFPYDPSSIASLESQDPNVACQVPAGDAAIAVRITSYTAKVNAVFDAINAQSPGGQAPTAEALSQAYNYFTVSDGQCLIGDKFIVLVTNGDADCNTGLSCGADTCTENLSGNCSSDTNCCDGAGYLCQDDDAVVAAITQLALAGVPTYVVGMPDTAAAVASLNAYAQAGVVPNVVNANGPLYYPITESTGIPDLETAFSSITPQLVRTCDIPLTYTPSDPASGHVYKDCIEILPATGDSGAGGWTIDYSYSPPHLELVGDACSQIQQYGALEVDVMFDCPKK